MPRTASGGLANQREVTGICQSRTGISEVTGICQSRTSISGNVRDLPIPDEHFGVLSIY
ncbi:Uncharacterized protein dnm_018820 [Desulfonema magnum]|uniref:Uncharacterized protein n=1 Tax=Desulfonema magnum TaxID=45655 RepID=A0A975BI85_9BACT|nr:Uncharacterized protein dnm_018820 [Desulfonema magnum]